jgi:DmsE family decaheme c-type cytochrome
MTAIPRVQKSMRAVSRLCILGVWFLVAGGSLHAQPARDDGALLTTLCTACHRDKFDALPHNPHGVLADADWQERTGRAVACLNCHTDAAEHARRGGGRGTVVAFREEPALERNAICLGCHRTTHPEFDRSPHAQAGLACTSCHSQHTGNTAATLLRSPNVPADVARLGPRVAICFDCHGERFSEFTQSQHHRLREGALECTSCHDPHAPATRSMLGGFKQEVCIGCHTDKGGPFVFEHPASRTEGCTVCHAPHGSPNRHLLATQPVAELCLSCHAAIPQFHLGFSPVGPPRFSLDTQCTNCHSAIHGSNFDPRFLR